MKKLITNSNPFILLLLPVVFALTLGIGYQWQQAKEYRINTSTAHATSLFIKSIGLIKTVCEVAKEKLW